MFSLETIISMNNQAALRARREKLQPWEPQAADDFQINRANIPHFGDYTPKPWKPVEGAQWFVDSSGFGKEGEPALTLDQFLTSARDYWAANHNQFRVGFAAVEHGQFQCYVQAYHAPLPGKPKQVRYTLPESLTIDRIMEAISEDDYVGFCLHCGSEAYSVEPDARNYRCESCGNRRVFGAEELLVMFAW